MKRKFCLPCFLELKKAGKHEITRVGGGKNMKITCWRCKRRRYKAIGGEVFALFLPVFFYVASVTVRDWFRDIKQEFQKEDNDHEETF